MCGNNEVYDVDSKYISWLKVEQFATLFDPEVDEESELWAKAVGKYAVDEAFVPDSGKGMLSVDVRSEEKVSGHDWISSKTRQPHALQITLDGSSDCGKDLKDCYDFNCKHKSWVKSAEWLPVIRDEYKEEWTSLSDRPTENDNFGLPGLRMVEFGDVKFFRNNVLCEVCRIYTSKHDDVCQMCESSLVSM